MAKPRNADYQRGYAAGRAARDRITECARFDQFYAAAMTGLLSGRPWQRGGVADKNPADFARTAKSIAKAMVGECP